MNNDELFNQGNEIFKQALKLKNDAIKSNKKLNIYKEAAVLFAKAADIIDKLQKMDLSTEELYQSKAYYFYYKHEEYECLYGYEIKENILNAKDIIKQSNKFVRLAIEVVEDYLSNKKGSLGSHFSKFLKDLKHREIITNAKFLEPDAKLKSRSGAYIEALDLYNKMLRLYKHAVEFSIKNNLDEKYVRIDQGNYFALCLNISQMYSANISEIQNSNNTHMDLDTDLLKHFLDSYDYSIKAFKSNPEWEEYRTGQDVMQDNIITLLNNNKKRWNNYLIDIDNNKELIKFMKKIDMSTFKKISAKQEIYNNEYKNLFFSGGFYLILFLIITIIVIIIFTSNIPIIYMPIAIFSIILLFSVIGAFILRTNKQLSEENFIKLMLHTLNFGFKSIKYFIKNDKNK